MGDVDEAAEFWILEAGKDALSLCKDAVAIVGLLDLNKDKREPIDEQGDIWSEFLITIFAGEFGDDME